MAWRPLAAVATAVVVSAGCASEQTPQLGTEKSFDGLVRVKSARSTAAWVDPNLDLSRYTKLKLRGAGIEYRPVAPPESRGRRMPTQQLTLSDDQKARFREIMKDEFTREMGRSQRFALSEETGPEVLLVSVALLDVVAFVRPGGRVALGSVGEAKLVVELHDSQTDRTLARMVDHRAAHQAESNFNTKTASGEQEVRRLAATWARLVRRRIDEAPTLRGGVVVQ